MSEYKENRKLYLGKLNNIELLEKAINYMKGENDVRNKGT